MVYGDFDRRLERVVDRIEKTVPAEDKKVLFDFLKQAEADGISTPRQERLLDIMRSIREEIGKHFSEITKDDLLLLVGRWEKRQKAGKLTAWSVYTFRAVVKKFFKWYKGNNEDYPPEVKWMKNGMKDVNKKIMNQNELISETDILKITDSAPSTRDRAFLGVLYDSGGRPKEIISLRYGDVIIDDKTTQIRIREGKTGQRLVNLVIFTNQLMSWMEMHPSHKASDPLW
ncbi:MAG TPA: tyrosine-type recombinase/integrase, partial [Candidatus Norongarragalinales archaeon]|nr:tyrosine-type recombinase/integrase [Candidatus Norongarragalinales archaeon]